MADWKPVAITDAQLEVSEHGSGEPVLLVQTALTADELRPLALALAPRGYRTILTHRRGYGAASPAERPGSITRDARDCAELLTALKIDRTHVVGLSYAGAVALQLAADADAVVHSLVLLEPPPVHIPGRDSFLAANEQLLETRRERGPEVALEEFLPMIMGPDWEQVAEEELPGSAAQMRRDARTFFDSDIPALLEWEFTAEQVAAVRCPVLYVGGTDSGPWFAEVRELILDWFPDAEDVVVDGADHSLALTHPQQIGDAVTGFLRRNPLP